MPPDTIDSPVARTRKAKRLWLWGSVACALLTWLVFWWVSDHQISVTLPDGRVISYAGTLNGTRITDNEFEPYIYFYPEGSFMTILERIRQKVERLLSSRRAVYAADKYRLSPELLMLRIEGPRSLGGIRAYLDDGFGNMQSLIASQLTPGKSRPNQVNYTPLPKGSPIWEIDFWDNDMLWNDSQQLGKLKIPNPTFKIPAQFECKSLPLESRTSKGVLQLISAKYTTSNTNNYANNRYVALEFDASACFDLLPCYVIGVRITDSWGNTKLIRGALSSDGKTILAEWRLGSELDQTIMQSADWHIKIALCRGRGAFFAEGDVAVFEHFITTNYRSNSASKILRGRQLTLSAGSRSFRADPKKNWVECSQTWTLDKKGHLLWPVLIKAIGYTAEGTVEIDPTKSGEKLENSIYRVERERFKRVLGSEHEVFTNDFLFKGEFKSPPGLKDIDLHIALEEPQVFEFFAKISNWPTTSTKTEDSRK